MTPARAITPWLISPVPERRYSWTADGELALSLQISRSGQHIAVASLRLTVTEAEHLHAGLCHALAGRRPPWDAPDCRQPSQGPVVRWP
ncbi:hypothetical protein LRS74_20790 [Streptomyces sp. LX-29]|uniref:hypothetical protein n=1 Tax=Streptomyces sp. LX-29 TaxID=2900152 RepID=UPI00240E2D70|nr:hypothetical protein [Streptomyces sp. LX-29]WFB09202.1 hypothetical protein LRS74_20790 [Streptomyces sp. LX-29]